MSCSLYTHYSGAFFFILPLLILEYLNVFLPSVLYGTDSMSKREEDLQRGRTAVTLLILSLPASPLHPPTPSTSTPLPPPHFLAPGLSADIILFFHYGCQSDLWGFLQL